jgi:peptide/nickel transport system permease protein
VKTSQRIRVALGLLLLVHTAALVAGFIAPYSPTEQNRSAPFAPPTRVRFIDAEGRFHLRPFVYRRIPRPGTFDEYDEDRSHRYPLRFFVPGPSYTIAGMLAAERHLFRVDDPATIFLFGTDEFGRDVFSRLLFGAQISLVTGLLAAGLAVVLGVVVGGLGGFYGGWVDDGVMRVAELFLALPWLYLLLAVRSALPLHIDPGRALLLLVAVIGLVGWTRPARLVRGVVLSARHRDYVVAARAFGATDRYLILRHVVPQATGLVLTQLGVLIPQYILAEVTLSFFGLGVPEPVPSWGNMLAALQRYDVLTSYWWMFLPGILLSPVVLLYYLLTNALHQQTALVSS